MRLKIRKRPKYWTIDEKSTRVFLRSIVNGDGNAADQKDFRRGADTRAGRGLGPRCEGLETAPQSAARLASALQAKAMFGGHRRSAFCLLFEPFSF